MNRHVFAAFLVLCMGARAAAADAVEWEIRLGGRSVGSELIEWSGAGLAGEGSFAAQGLQFAYAYTVELDAGRMLKHSVTTFTKPNQAVMDTETEGPVATVTVSSGGRVVAEKEFEADEHTILLDNNIVGHYLLLATVLDPMGSAEVGLHLLVPQALLSLDAKARRGEQFYTWHRSSTDTGRAVRWEIALAGNLLYVYQDAISRDILRAEIPGQHVEYFRKDTQIDPDQHQAAVPEYLDGSGVREETVRITSGGFELEGVLATPADRSDRLPGVLLIGGSGPSDRDGTVGGMKVYRDLAVGLAHTGCAVLRYDDRTYAYRNRIDGLGVAEMTVQEEVIDDAVAALRALADDPAVDPRRLVVVGHSLGGWCLPFVYDALGPLARNVTLLVYLAAPAREWDELLLDQLTYQRELTGESAYVQDTIDSVRDSFARLRSGDLPPGRILGATTGYWQDLLDRDPVELARGIDVPMLFIAGGKDIQVTAADSEIWKHALGDRDDVRFVAFPNLNHLFAVVEGRSTGAEYFRQAFVASEVITTLAGAIERAR